MVARQLRSSGPRFLSAASRRLMWALACVLLLAVAAKIRRGVRAPRVQVRGELLHENSALVNVEGSGRGFWSIADSGSAPALYRLDDKGTIQQTFPIDGPKNTDWEDMASDGGQRLFIADVGDNFGRRAVLSVIEVGLSQAQSPISKPIAVYNFRYPLPNLTLANNYDAEGLVFLGGQLYLFTKRRGDTGSEIYRLMAEPSMASKVQAATRIAQIELAQPGAWFHFGQMVTAASIDREARRIAVLTYRNVLVYEDLNLEPWDRAHKRSAAQSDARIRRLLSKPPLRWDLSLSQTRQCEGISFRGSKIFVSNEEGKIMDLERVGRRVLDEDGRGARAEGRKAK